MTPLKLLYTLICSVPLLAMNAQDQCVRINEFMASNTKTLADEDNDYSDWIELYNNSQTDVSLNGWSLTDEKSIPDMWIFPDVTLKAGCYLLIFASGKDKKNPSSQLHTNFRLSASGEHLSLYDKTGNVISSIRSFPSQYEDKSYGYTFKDENNTLCDGFDYLTIPTPGKMNASGIYNIIYSHKHGFYNDKFMLYLHKTGLEDNTVIYYTKDGSLPDSGSEIYSEGIEITDNSVIRAVVLDNTCFTPVAKHVKSNTYLFFDKILSQPAAPIGYPLQWGQYSQISGTAIADYEMDPELTSQKAYADSIVKGLKELPVISVVTDKNNLFSKVEDATTGGIYIFTGPPTGGPGKGWDRPVSFEYFDYSDSVSFQVNCGIRIHGGHSRLADKTPKHSFRLVFKEPYGETKLRYPFFGYKAAPTHNAIVLRCFFGNSWLHRSKAERDYAQYAREAWGKRTQQKMGHPSSYTQFAHLFINGLYWGLYNPLERIDDAYCAEYYGGHELDYDVIKVEDTNNQIEAGEGTLDVWLELIEKCAKAANNEVYYSIIGKDANGNVINNQPLLDLENFIDYMLMNFYGANSDWDHHNWVAVRNRVNPSSGFHFYSWDAEQLNKNVNDNILKENNAKCPSYIFQQLRTNKHFINAFADRVRMHCFDGGALTPEGASSTWKDILSEMESSLYAESARWGDYRRDVHPYTSKGELYRKDIQYDKLKKYMLETQFPERTAVFISHLRQAGLYPEIDSPSFRINGLICDSDTVYQGDLLSLTSEKGIVYYTLDGSDPVLWNESGVGIRTEKAIKYTSPISLDASVTIKARCFYSSKWSALNLKQLTVAQETSISDCYNAKDLIKINAISHVFTDKITVHYNLQADSDININIINLMGVEFYKDNFRNKAGDGFVTVNATSFSKGIYLCRISFKSKVGNKTFTYKIIKQ